jgi:hypothetical protein
MSPASGLSFRGGLHTSFVGCSSPRVFVVYSPFKTQCSSAWFRVSRRVPHQERSFRRGAIFAEVRRSTDNYQTVLLSLVGGGQWLTPDDWDGDNNKIECIGGGGGGTACGGGEGGAYSAIINVKLIPGSVVKYFVGTGGRGGTTSANAGLPTIFGGEFLTNCLCAAPGGASATTSEGGESAQIEQAVGMVKRRGGSGAAGSSWNGGGGGGAGGSVGHGFPGWRGSPGYTGLGGPGGLGNGEKSGSGGSGARGTSVGCGTDGENGSLHGGGGGGASYASTRGTGGNGAQGLIKITYIPKK